MLELREVSAGYGDVAVLRRVSLAVPDGAVVALLGPNGAGKTTLLRVACGLLHPQAGEVVLDGHVVTRRPADDLTRRGMCHVGEGRSIFRSMTVRENLAMFAPRSAVAEVTEAAIASFPVLGRRLDQVAGTLSGGEQQMLALSRTHRPDIRVVLLDEVSMGLAPKVVDEIFAFLRELAAQGVSLLLVEQYVELALQLAEYVYLLGRGEVRFAGEPAELDAADIFAEYVLSPA